MRAAYQANWRLSNLGQVQSGGVIFLLRREPLYHKLQYSKVPKFDAAAAAFGVIVGAFVVYMGLSSLGSASADLTDLTVLCWYAFIWFTALRVFVSTVRVTGLTVCQIPSVTWFAPFVGFTVEVAIAVLACCGSAGTRWGGRDTPR